LYDERTGDGGAKSSLTSSVFYRNAVHDSTTGVVLICGPESAGMAISNSIFSETKNGRLDLFCLSPGTIEVSNSFFSNAAWWAVGPVNVTFGADNVFGTNRATTITQWVTTTLCQVPISASAAFTVSSPFRPTQTGLRPRSATPSRAFGPSALIPATAPLGASARIAPSKAVYFSPDLLGTPLSKSAPVAATLWHATAEVGQTATFAPSRTLRVVVLSLTSVLAFTRALEQTAVACSSALAASLLFQSVALPQTAVLALTVPWPRTGALALSGQWLASADAAETVARATAPLLVSALFASGAIAPETATIARSTHPNSSARAPATHLPVSDAPCASAAVRGSDATGVSCAVAASPVFGASGALAPTLLSESGHLPPTAWMPESPTFSVSFGFLNATHFDEIEETIPILWSGFFRSAAPCSLPAMPTHPPAVSAGVRGTDGHVACTGEFQRTSARESPDAAATAHPAGPVSSSRAFIDTPVFSIPVDLSPSSPPASSLLLPEEPTTDIPAAASQTILGLKLWAFAAIVAAVAVLVGGVAAVLIVRRARWVTEYYTEEEKKPENRSATIGTEMTTVGHQFTNPLADETIDEDQVDFLSHDPGEAESITMI
jgi:hypothetical protein